MSLKDKIDPEILEGFREESRQLLKELHEIVEKLEVAQDVFPSVEMKDFALKIDRIMGTSKTLEMDAPDHPALRRISRIGELSKKLGNDAVARKDRHLIPLFAGFWADTLEVLGEIFDHLDDEVILQQISSQFSLIVQKRLEWLAEKLRVNKGTETAQQAIIDVESFLKDFKL